MPNLECADGGRVLSLHQDHDTGESKCQDLCPKYDNALNPPEALLWSLGLKTIPLENVWKLVGFKDVFKDFKVYSLWTGSLSSKKTNWSSK